MRMLKGLACMCLPMLSVMDKLYTPAFVTEYIAKYVPDLWFVESTEISLLAAALLSLSGIAATSSNVLLRFLG